MQMECTHDGSLLVEKDNAVLMQIHTVGKKICTLQFNSDTIMTKRDQ